MPELRGLLCLAQWQPENTRRLLLTSLRRNFRSHKTAIKHKFKDVSNRKSDFVQQLTISKFFGQHFSHEGPSVINECVRCCHSNLLHQNMKMIAQLSDEASELEENMQVYESPPTSSLLPRFVTPNFQNSFPWDWKLVKDPSLLWTKVQVLLNAYGPQNMFGFCLIDISSL